MRGLIALVLAGGCGGESHAPPEEPPPVVGAPTKDLVRLEPPAPPSADDPDGAAPSTSKPPAATASSEDPTAPSLSPPPAPRCRLDGERVLFEPGPLPAAELGARAFGRLTPVRGEDGEVEGLLVQGVAPADLMGSCGFINGDVLVALDEQPLRRSLDFFKAFRALGSEEQLTLQLTFQRDGELWDLDLHAEPLAPTGEPGEADGP